MIRDGGINYGGGDDWFNLLNSVAGVGFAGEIRSGGGGECLSACVCVLSSRVAAWLPVPVPVPRCRES